MYQTSHTEQKMTQTWQTRSPAVARVGLTVLVATDLKNHPKLMTFMSSEKAYATSC